jgi:hypothetical protein
MCSVVMVRSPRGTSGAHHLADDPQLVGFFAAGLGQLDVHVQAEVVAEQVREDRIDRPAFQARHTQEVVADLRDPVRGCTSSTSGLRRSMLSRAWSYAQRNGSHPPSERGSFCGGFSP